MGGVRAAGDRAGRRVHVDRSRSDHPDRRSVGVKSLADDCFPCAGADRFYGTVGRGVVGGRGPEYEWQSGAEQRADPDCCGQAVRNAVDVDADHPGELVGESDPVSCRERADRGDQWPVEVGDRGPNSDPGDLGQVLDHD